MSTYIENKNNSRIKSIELLKEGDKNEYGSDPIHKEDSIIVDFDLPKKNGVAVNSVVIPMNQDSIIELRKVIDDSLVKELNELEEKEKKMSMNGVLKGDAGVLDFISNKIASINNPEQGINTITQKYLDIDLKFNEINFYNQDKNNLVQDDGLDDLVAKHREQQKSGRDEVLSSIQSEVDDHSPEIKVPTEKQDVKSKNKLNK